MRKWLVVFMTVIAAGLVGAMVWLYTMADRKGPEIVVESGKNNIYSQDMTTEELLEDVNAVDEKDGDVSDTLKVENIYPNSKGDKVTVVYVAKDSSNNVTKFTYYMTTDGEKDYGESESEGKEKQKKADTSEERDESEDFDTPEESDEEAEDEEQEESEENLTEEEKAQKREEEKISKLNPQDPRFYLTTYYLKIAKGTSIDKLSYVKDIEDDTDAANELYRKIQITGNVDVNTPGTYELTYYVVDSAGNSSNGAVLTIVVE